MGLPVDSTLDFLEPQGSAPAAPAVGSKLWVMTDGTLHLRQVAADKTVATTDQRAPALWLDTSATAIQTPATTDAGLTGQNLQTGDFVIRTSDGEVFQFTSPSTFTDQSYSVQTGSMSAPNAQARTVARAYRNGALALTANTWTKVPLDTVVYDPGGNMDVVTNHRYNVPVAGYYQVNIDAEVNESATGTYTQMIVGVYQNGVLVFRTNQQPSVESVCSAQIADVIYCNAGDYLELWVFNSQATSLASGSSQINYLSVAMLAPATTAPVSLNTGGRAHNSASLSVVATSTKVRLNTIDAPVNAAWDTANYRFTVPTAGWYFISGEVDYNLTGATDSARAVIQKNGAAAINGAKCAPPVSAVSVGLPVSGMLFLNQGDYVELWLVTSQTGGLILGSATGEGSWLSVVKVDQQVPQINAQNTGGRAYRSVIFTLTANTTVKVPVDHITSDPGGHINVAGTDATASKGRYTVTSPGWYQVSGQMTVSVGTNNTNLTVQAHIYRNGAVAAQGNQAPQSSNVGFCACGVSDIIYCNTGDYLELWCYSSGAYGLGISTSNNYMSVVKVDQPAVISNAAPPTVSSLPTSPVDGQEIYFVADATNGVKWHLRYNAGSASSHKWEYLGGPEMYSFNGPASPGSFTLTANTWAVVPGLTSIVAPLAGDYDVTVQGVPVMVAAGPVEISAFTVINTSALSSLGQMANGGLSEISSTMFGAIVEHERCLNVAAAVNMGIGIQATVGVTIQVYAASIRVKPVRVG